MTKLTKGPLAELGAAIAAQERELELRDPETGFIKEIPKELIQYLPRWPRKFLMTLPAVEQRQRYTDAIYSIANLIQHTAAAVDDALHPETEEAAMNLVRHGAAAYFALQENPTDGDAMTLSDIIYGQLGIAEQEK